MRVVCSLTLALAVLGLSLAWTDQANGCGGCRCQPGGQPGGAVLPKFDPAKIKQVTLSVDGMTCASCVATATKALAAVPGVTHVQVDLKSKQATVLVEINRFNEATLLTALQKAGYPGKMLK